MVLWEVTLATAYFLGLKRTYRLALRLQRRLIGPNHPRIREFAYKRTRKVFDMAVTVHKKIQQRDIEVGRNLGNWILRWLDRMKPSAEIRPKEISSCKDMSKDARASSLSNEARKPYVKPPEKGTKDRLLFSPLNARSQYFQTVSMKMQARYFGTLNGQYRTISATSAPSHVKRCARLGGVFRDDIAQLMQ